MSRKTLNLITIILLVVSVLIGVFTWFSSDALKAGEWGRLNPLLWWTEILLCLALILAIVMPIPAIIKNPKSLKRTMLIVAGFIGLFVIVYFLSSGAPSSQELAQISTIKQDSYKEASTVANMNITGVFIMVILSICAILWSSVKGLIKR